MLNKYKQTVKKARESIERTEAQLSSLLGALSRAESRAQWARSQAELARIGLEEAKLGTEQFATCLDALVGACDSEVPYTYARATEARYALHAAAMASLLRDALVDGLVRPTGTPDVYALTEAGHCLRDLAFDLRARVRKLPE